MKAFVNGVSSAIGVLVVDEAKKTARFSHSCRVSALDFLSVVQAQGMESKVRA